MYAVIKTGGKQYRVQPGDLLVVEKLDGDVGAEIAFNDVLMLGDDGKTHLGAPLIDGGVVRATLIETRKGDKVHTVKKIRRQGHRRTKGHRQFETVLRVTGLEGAGLSAKWDGEVDLTPLSTLRLRARGLAPRVEETVEAPKPAPKKAAAKPSAKTAEVVDEQAAAAAAPEAAAPETAAEAPKPAKKAAAAKTATDAGVVDEQTAAAEAPAKPKKAAAPKKKASDEASSETE